VYLDEFCSCVSGLILLVYLDSFCSCVSAGSVAWLARFGSYFSVSDLGGAVTSMPGG
jgi:hypothetical protein